MKQIERSNTVTFKVVQQLVKVFFVKLTAILLDQQQQQEHRFIEAD